MSAALVEYRAGGAAAAPPILEARSGDGRPLIVGLAAAYYDPKDPGTEYDMFGDGSLLERLMPGCFDRALRERDDAACLVNHDENLILGRVASGTLRLRTDAKGLRYEASPPETPTGDETVELLRRGDLSGSSFSFVVLGQRWLEAQGTVIREILDLRLYDVSCVLRPAYSSTSAGVTDAIAPPERSSWSAADHAAAASLEHKRRLLDLKERENYIPE